jgi:hypothetical protein
MVSGVRANSELLKARYWTAGMLEGLKASSLIASWLASLER